MSEILVGAAEGTGEALGMSQIFIGIVFLAIVGGAAECGSAIAMARKNKMDLAVGIALGSSIQIALFVAPVLVLASYVVAPQPLELSFTRAEVGALFMAVLIGALVAGDGRSNWYQGRAARRRVPDHRPHVLPPARYSREPPMKSQTWKALLRFWAADRGLSIFLGLLILIIFVLPAFATPGLLSRLAGNVAFSLLLVAGAVAMPEYRWMSIYRPADDGAGSGRTVGEYRHVFNSISRHGARFPARSPPCRCSLSSWQREISTAPARSHASASSGSVAVYLLLGLTWASAYELLHILRPGAWTGTASEFPVAQTWIYYSFVTLTTTGYGDIAPVRPFAG